MVYVLLVCKTVYWYSSFTSKIENQDFAMAFIRAEDKELQRMQHQLDGCGQSQSYRLLLATFLDLRFVIKFIYAPTTEKIGGGEGLNSRFGSSSNDSLLFSLLYRAIDQDI